MKICTKICKKQRIDNFKPFIKIHPFRFAQRKNGAKFYGHEDLNAQNHENYKLTTQKRVLSVTKMHSLIKNNSGNILKSAVNKHKILNWILIGNILYGIVIVC